MQQHVLDDGIGALAVLDDLFEVVFQQAREFVDFVPQLFAEHGGFEARHSIRRSAPPIARRKLLTKLSGFLISCAMPAVSWPSEASFSVCTRRSCAVRNWSSEAASSLVRACTFVEQADVLDRNHRLVGEGLHEFYLDAR